MWRHKKDMHDPIIKYYVINSINSQPHPYAEALGGLLTQKIYGKYFREDRKPRETIVGAGDDKKGPRRSEWSIWS